MVSAVGCSPPLVTSHVLEGFGKYPYRGPREVSLSHQSRRSVIFPTAAASSAYHICLQCPSSSLINGIVARAYMGMASGSPCVVPSCDRMVSPSTKRSVGALYVLVRIEERGGQILLMLWRAVCLFSELNASTSTSPKILPRVFITYGACARGGGRRPGFEAIVPMAQAFSLLVTSRVIITRGCISENTPTRNYNLSSTLFQVSIEK